MRLLDRATAVAVLCALTMSASAVRAEGDAPFTIYMALWRGCEAACLGFKDEIEKSGIDAVFIERDAAQDKSKLPEFIEEAHAVAADLVLTWGTTVTVGMAGALKDAGDPGLINDIPVVYMVVADAVASGIVESFERTGRANVTGTHNRVPEEVNINAIRSYYPDFKRLGMLYSSAEGNSVVKVEEVRELSVPMGFDMVAVELELDAAGRPIAESIPGKMKELKESGVDFIYVGSSSFIEENGAVFTASALEQGIPVLSPYERLVTEADALLSVSARYFAIGQLAARQAVRILVDGVEPGELPVLAMEQFAFVINMESARKLKLFPPLELLQIAETIH